MRELNIDQAIFIGFKVDSQLQQKIASLSDTLKTYVSTDSSTFLRLCGSGEDLYIGKLVDGRLMTDQVEDIRRNVLSLVRKMGHETRLPTHLQIVACQSTAAGKSAAADVFRPVTL